MNETLPESRFGDWRAEIVEAHSPTPLRPQLSRRERQTLLYTAVGMNRSRMSLLLHVKSTTIRTYQNRFTAKLGAANPQHAASRALMLGEFRKLSTIDTAATRTPRAPRPRKD